MAECSLASFPQDYQDKISGGMTVLIAINLAPVAVRRNVLGRCAP
jgi:hypothetical protein